MKEVTKKQLENAPKRKGGAKRQMVQMKGLIRPMLTKIRNYIVRIIFYRLILGHQIARLSVTENEFMMT